MIARWVLGRGGGTRWVLGGDGCGVGMGVGYRGTKCNGCWIGMGLGWRY